MKNKNIEPVPQEAQETVRSSILSALASGPVSAKEISGLVGIPEKEVAAHLEHIHLSLHRAGKRLIVQPAECVKCGFLFEKRERFSKPGKCPVCKSESIHAALFSVEAPA